MKSIPLILAPVVFRLGQFSNDNGQVTSNTPKKQDADKIAHVQRQLEEIKIDTKNLQREMPLAKFLAALEGALPEGKRISLSLDREALGQDLTVVEAYPIKLLRSSNNSYLQSIISSVISQIPKKADIDYAIRPGGVVFTRARFAAHTSEYDVRDVMEKMAQITHHLKRFDPDRFQNLKTDKNELFLVSTLLDSVHLETWESLQVLNRTKLVLNAAPRRHYDFIEVLQRAFQFGDVLQKEKKDGKNRGSGLEGVTFEVEPQISLDCRFVRMTIFQNVAHLPAIDKTSVLNASDGRRIDIESPNLQTNCLKGTIQILDADPILMPVSYLPPGKNHEGKVWLMVARPLIWIEEEVKYLKDEGKIITPKSVWDREPEKEEQKPVPKQLPPSNRVKQVCRPWSQMY